MDKFLTSKPALDTKSDTKEGLLLQDISNQLPETRRSNRKSLSVKEPNNNVIKKEKEKFLCGTCGKGVRSNSVQCTACMKWCHARCSGLKSVSQAGNNYRCPACLKEDVTDNTVLINGKTENAKLKREIKQEAEVNDEPVKKKAKTTKQKEKKIKEELDEDEEPADTNVGLSEYELKVQANIAERMKFLESLDIFKDKDELIALTPQPQKPATKKSFRKSLPAPVGPTEVRKSKRLLHQTPEGGELPPELMVARAEKMWKWASDDEKSDLSRPPAGPSPLEEYYTQPDKVEFQTFLNGLQSLSIPSSSESIWSGSEEKVLKTMKKMKIPEENVAKVVPQRTFSIAVHPTEEMVLVLAGGKKGNLGLWNVEAKEDKGIHFLHPHNRPINRITIHPNNHNQIYTTSYDGSVRCTDLKSNTVCEVYSTNDVPSWGDYISWHDHFEENFLMVATSDGTIDKVDLRDPGKAVANYHAHNGKSIKAVTCHPLSTQYFATCSSDGYVHLWDARKHKKDVPVASDLHGRSISGIAFSPLTGKHLVSICQDDYVRFLSTDFTKFKVDKKVRHNNHTGRWLTTFKPYWLPGQENLIALGAMVQPRRIEIMNISGTIIHNFMGEFMGSVTSVNAFHPTRPVVAGANSSGRVHVFTNF